MRRSSVCTRQWTSPWSTCSCTSACSCTGRFADGTAMHTLTNTRPTDRHTCTYRLIKPRVSRVDENRSPGFLFYSLCWKRPALPSSRTVASRRRNKRLYSFLSPRRDSVHRYMNILCCDRYGEVGRRCVSRKSKSHQNCTRERDRARGDLLSFASANRVNRVFSCDSFKSKSASRQRQSRKFHQPRVSVWKTWKAAHKCSRSSLWFLPTRNFNPCWSNVTLLSCVHHSRDHKNCTGWEIIPKSE